MPAPIKTYTPSDVKVILGGSYQLTGVVSLTIEFPTERFSIVRGTKGRNIRVMNKDKSCTLSIELLQTSTSNDVLSDILSKDSLAGTGRLITQVADLSGSTKIESRNSYVSSFPSVSFGSDFNTRTWQITMLDTNLIVIGGNALVRPKFLEDAANFISGAADKVVSVASGAASAVGDAVSSIF